MSEMTDPLEIAQLKIQLNETQEQLRYMKIMYQQVFEGMVLMYWLDKSSTHMEGVCRKYGMFQTVRRAPEVTRDDMVEWLIQNSIYEQLIMGDLLPPAMRLPQLANLPIN